MTDQDTPSVKGPPLTPHRYPQHPVSEGEVPTVKGVKAVSRARERNQEKATHSNAQQDCSTFALLQTPSTPSTPSTHPNKSSSYGVKGTDEGVKAAPQWCAVWHWPFHVKPYVKPFSDRATAERYVARQARINPRRRWVVEQRQEISA